MRLPRHATVVSYLALFMALGGTAYAATGGSLLLGHNNYAGQVTSLKNSGSGVALKLGTEKGTTANFSVSNATKITNLNADKLDGLSSTNFQIKSTPIKATASSASGSVSAGKAGPWTFSLGCFNGTGATFVISGPGDVGGTTSLAGAGGTATTYVGPLDPIGTGDTSIVGAGGQMSRDIYLVSGSTTIEVRVLLTASTEDPFIACAIVGSASAI